MNSEIQLAARTVGQPPRRGEILEVLGDDTTPHYRVRWDDGHESVLYPTAGTRVRVDNASVRITPVLDALSAAEIGFEVLPHRRTTTAAEEARALGVRPEAVGKTIVVHAGEDRVRVVVQASQRIDFGKLRRLFGTDIELLTEAELREAFPSFELGAVPPIGGPQDRLVVDADVAVLPSLIVEAGSHEYSLRITPADLVFAADALVADVSAG